MLIPLSDMTWLLLMSIVVVFLLRPTMNEDISLYMFTYFHSMLICCCLFANLRPVYPTLCFSVVVCLPIYVLFIQLYVYLLLSVCQSKSCLSNSMFICWRLFANLSPVYPTLCLSVVVCLPIYVLCAMSISVTSWHSVQSV